jgi:hypothetical protein
MFLCEEESNNLTSSAGKCDTFPTSREAQTAAERLLGC